MRLVSTSEFVTSVKAGNVKSLIAMIAEKSHAAWYNLPVQHRSMHSIADLMQEGKNFLITDAAYRYNPKKGMRFRSFAFYTLDHFYSDLVRAAQTEKRTAPNGEFSINTTIRVVNGRQESLLDRLKVSRFSRDGGEMRIINRIDAERAFIKAYRLASPKLRRYMIRWVIQPSPGRIKDGIEFVKAKKEFKLVVAPILSEELCDVIQQDHICRSNIANKVVKDFKTYRRPTKPNFLTSEEYALVSIIDLDTACVAMPTVG